MGVDQFKRQKSVRAGVDNDTDRRKTPHFLAEDTNCSPSTHMREQEMEKMSTLLTLILLRRSREVRQNTSCKTSVLSVDLTKNSSPWI